MATKAALVYSDEFMKYDFGPTHPLRPIRLKLTHELLRETGVLESPSVCVCPPRQATEDELLTVHSKEYVEEVKSFSKVGVGYLDLGDTPAFKGMHEATAVAVGGSIMAADLVMKGEATHAFNPAGGLHHAGRDHAAGFCVYNDIAVAIRHIQRNYKTKRVALVDLDVHHGDGTQEIFNSDPNVLIIDFHESGKYLFPGGGFIHEMGEGKAKGSKVNIPLPQLTSRECYLHAFDEIVPPLLDAFKPEVIVNQFGVDTHFGDPLAHLNLTTEVYHELASRLHAIAHEVCDGKYVVLGGGGYNPEIVAISWAIMFSTISEIMIPDSIPQKWINFCRENLGKEPPTTFSDKHGQAINRVEREKIVNAIEEIVKEIKTSIFPIHGIGQ